MTNDQELLEAAAKAAGIDAAFHPEPGDEGMWLKGARSPDNSKYWNPLNDDGDALRLAVSLGMNIDTQAGKVDCEFYVKRNGFDEWIYAETAMMDSPPIEVVRRAIVETAAKIGAALAPTP